jgi:beta-lactamase class A
VILGVALLGSTLQAQNPLTDKWQSIAAKASGRVGVAALVIGAGGERIDMNVSDHYPMQSVAKLPIAMAVFHLTEQNKLSLKQKVNTTPSEYLPTGIHSPLRDQFPNGTQISIRELIQFALVESDGSASDVLLNLAGGPVVVTQYVQSLGIRDLIIANSEKETTEKSQYEDWCTPDAAVQLLVELDKAHAISAPNRDLVLSYMQLAKSGATRIRALLPKGNGVADKTGSSRTFDGRTAATNDIGLVTLPDGRRLVIAVFLRDSTESDRVRDNVIAKIARMTYDYWIK